MTSSANRVEIARAFLADLFTIGLIKSKFVAYRKENPAFCFEGDSITEVAEIAEKAFAFYRNHDSLEDFVP
jgi:hypothetical protein